MIDRYKETFETWNKVAQIYQNKFMTLDLYNESYDLFCNLVTKASPNILELGCGPGNITQYIHKKITDCRIEAIDVAPSMIALAKKNCPSVDFKVMDIRMIDQLKSKYDAIVCGFCIPYLSKSDVEKLIIDCGQLLSAEGILYVSFVDGNYKDSGYQTGSSGDRTYFYYHNIVEVLAGLEKENFNVVRLIPVLYEKSTVENEVHTVIIAQKQLQ